MVSVYIYISRYEEAEEECVEDEVVSESTIPEEQCELFPVKTCQEILSKT